MHSDCRLIPTMVRHAKAYQLFGLHLLLRVQIDSSQQFILVFLMLSRIHMASHHVMIPKSCWNGLRVCHETRFC